MESAEFLASISKSGSKSGNEWAWTLQELIELFKLAKKNNIAALGGTAQFRLENGTCEMYWCATQWQKKEKEESWEEFVLRSNDNSLSSLVTLSETVDFINEAKQWPHVRELTLDKNLNPLDFLFYAFYFASPEEYEKQKLS